MKVSSFLILSAFQTSRDHIAEPISTSSSSSRADSEYSLHAKPKRLGENVEGLLYVNDRVSVACSTFEGEKFIFKII